MIADAQFREVAQRFLDGDHSIDAAARIESVVLEHFDDTELCELLAEPLALYRPGEGTPYTDELELANVLKRALLDLDARAGD